jgi:hypothetical protein
MVYVFHIAQKKDIFTVLYFPAQLPPLSMYSVQRWMRVYTGCLVTLCQYLRTLFLRLFLVRNIGEHASDSQRLRSYGYSKSKMIWTLRRTSGSFMRLERHKTRSQMCFQRDRATHISVDGRIRDGVPEWAVPWPMDWSWWSAELATVATGSHSPRLPWKTWCLNAK